MSIPTIKWHPLQIVISSAEDYVEFAHKGIISALKRRRHRTARNRHPTKTSEWIPVNGPAYRPTHRGEILIHITAPSRISAHSRHYSGFTQAALRPHASMGILSTAALASQEAGRSTGSIGAYCSRQNTHSRSDRLRRLISSSPSRPPQTPRAIEFSLPWSDLEDD